MVTSCSSSCMFSFLGFGTNDNPFLSTSISVFVNVVSLVNITISLFDSLVFSTDSKELSLSDMEWFRVWL